MPKISIIIPIYNSEKYLKKCLDSVINQTLEDIEIICIDDCSTDNSRKILEEYKAKDNRIKLLFNKENKGQGYTRNIGIDTAIGEYIGFIDSDDEIEKKYYQYLYSRAKDNCVDMASANIMYHFEENNTKQMGSWIKKSEQKGELLIDLKDKLSRVYCNCATSPCKHIYKREMIINHKIRFASGLFHEDQYYNLKAYYYANKVITEEINSPIYYYLVHKDSSMNKDVKSANYKKTKFDQIEIIKKSLEFLHDQNVSDEIINILLDAYKTLIHNNILSFIDTMYISEYIIEAKKIGFDDKFKKKLTLLYYFNKLNINQDMIKLTNKIKRIKKYIGVNQNA